jgi:GTPase Era involved in 16S rRNA processing
VNAHRLVDIARRLDAIPIADDASAMLGRIDERRFFVACIGQFKRGKSTLLNALVGDRVLPTGVAPVTSVMTILRDGISRSARVMFATGEERDVPLADLAEYVTEARNPANAKRVTRVDVFLPHPLLAEGLWLVDTPGLGSVFVPNADVTHALVPQIDAALIVLGGDPPISRDELDLIVTVAGQIDHLIVVLNKSDRLPEDDRREARAFTERLLSAQIRMRAGEMLEVSATERLETGVATRDWHALERALRDLIADSSAILTQARQRVEERVTARLLNEIEERRGALMRPVAESERRVAALQESAADAGRSLSDLGALFTADERHLARALEERRLHFLAATRDDARRELSAGIAASDDRGGQPLRRRAYELAQEKARSIVSEWLRRVGPEADDMYRRVARRFMDMANQHLGRLKPSSPVSFVSLPDRIDVEAGFRTPRRFVETDVLRLASPRFITRILDVAGPRSAAIRAIQRDVGNYFDYLLEVNSSRVEHDLNDRVRESGRALEAEIRSLLNHIVASAQRALAEARARHIEGEAAVRLELDRLAVFEREIKALARATGDAEVLERRS